MNEPSWTLSPKLQGATAGACGGMEKQVMEVTTALQYLGFRDGSCAPPYALVMNISLVMEWYVVAVGACVS